MNRFTVLAGVGTIILFGIGGIWIIEYWQGRNFIEVLVEGWNIPLQLLTGVIAGAVSAGVALLIITRSFFKEERKYYYDLICNRLQPSILGIVFISLCAGIGEEIFFRAGLQPLIGLWPTSILFVLIHGYLNPRNKRILLYGIFMLLVIAGFGYLYRYTGLFTVMIAHSVFDLILLLHVYFSRKGKEDQSADRASNPSSSM